MLFPIVNFVYLVISTIPFAIFITLNVHLSYIFVKQVKTKYWVSQTDLTCATPDDDILENKILRQPESKYGIFQKVYQPLEAIQPDFLLTNAMLKVCVLYKNVHLNGREVLKG